MPRLKPRSCARYPRNHALAVRTGLIPVAILALAALSVAGNTELISVSSTGEQGNGESRHVSISGNGRYVVFESDASNLVPDDTNGRTDVFLHDRWLGTTKRISVDASGAELAGRSFWPRISIAGTAVVYVTQLPDRRRISIHSVLTGVTIAGPEGSLGAPPDVEDYGLVAQVAFSGRGVSYAGQTFPGAHLLLWEVVIPEREGRIDVVAAATDPTSTAVANLPAIKGCSIAFQSSFTDLVEGDTNGAFDIFIRDCWQSIVERVSLRWNGAQAEDFLLDPKGSLDPDIDQTGRLVVFSSDANDLAFQPRRYAVDAMEIFLRDRGTSQTFRISTNDDDAPEWAYPLNYEPSWTTGCSYSPGSHSPVISEDGRYVAFSTTATEIFLGYLPGGYPDRWENPRRLCGPSWGTETVPVRVIVRRDLWTQRNELISDPVTWGDWSDSFAPAISGSGRYVAYWSLSEVLVHTDSNGVGDVFVRDLRTLQERLADLVDMVQNINLTHGIVNSLDAKLQVAQEAFVSQKGGDWTSSCNLLEAFVKEVEAQSGKQISADDARALTREAGRVMAEAYCQ